MSLTAQEYLCFYRALLYSNDDTNPRHIDITSYYEIMHIFSKSAI